MNDGYVLIVDDDADIRNMVGIYLENEGLPYIKCEDAGKALEILDNHKIDLILLDIMMPGIDGMDACIQIREKSQIPIIFMSAKSQDIDKVQGLMVGADDYVVKPFNPIELIARVKAQLRRYKQYNENAVSKTMQYKELVLNGQTRQVWMKGEEIRLTPKEFSILELLMKNRGIVLTICQIYEQVWREEFAENDNTVLMHISNLREKIEGKGQEFQYIKTVWGAGYKI
ncbi:response regulator transcription factor [Bariatricus massiliensis]|uniref:Stage 0 sporulation protein A homolog n=1 Tax=Bariatricus massiliensis TaxID=1745713 RepID=A0ABS8DFH9_9FIRM|nr:response regulator transcription factor [Bariatricus massiliensis]MCB7304060.1 response regulator transcription factor [Bariatricus massiliensis]MCB7374509.1 response regulator transcription factor [Bariatricus massiliensis]MCB7387170.1 response regulator transcription factor [Bariatricus massiliensis]MCB7411332.1 response regulator transcription factor [Bariatricus massiliensis]MCQ5252723.1 response regulator transcription factor [Bariatricus massiliensis]